MLLKLVLFCFCNSVFAVVYIKCNYENQLSTVSLQKKKNCVLKQLNSHLQFDRQSELFYSCIEHGPGLSSINERVVSVDGMHLENFTNIRVESVQLLETSYLLHGLSAFFINIIRFGAVDAGVKVISRADFSEFNKLKILELGGNKITKIPGDAFYDLKRLQYLDLKGNKLVFLPDNLLYYQPLLRRLVLGNNKLQSFSWTTVEKNLQLKKIFMQSNNIIMISPGLIIKFNNLKDNFAFDCHVSLNNSNFAESINKFCNKDCASNIKNVEYFKNQERICKTNLLKARQVNEMLQTEEKTCIIDK